MQLPELDPDVIDDFVTWLTSHGYDLYSFQISDVKFKADLFRMYRNQLPPEKQQFKIDFPE